MTSIELVKIWAGGFFLFLTLLTFVLWWAKRLKDPYAVGWIVAFGLASFLAFQKRILVFLGFQFTPGQAVLVALLIFLTLLLYIFSIRLSELSSKIEKFAEDYAVSSYQSDKDKT